ncbi:hypothetical protein TNIN_381281 [Trichonephila inaurata madagascariensis]|uniref:Uncharacterized protein n=1 Tax=Trichonephila inaurata madagascariensis TaxID=2747483 RepID=A0A8X6XSF9_9ARAC|nr:hypothetical protein TNIN_476221 [Trichonephila inaurata madagascariensis]GFY57809.1 hypothetical protein TNIN_381281 [Trichonephila inaurata madagascariensis]
MLTQRILQEEYSAALGGRVEGQTNNEFSETAMGFLISGHRLFQKTQRSERGTRKDSTCTAHENKDLYNYCQTFVPTNSDDAHRRQEEEPMDWEDTSFLPEVSAPFVPSRLARKMRSLISVQVSEPPSLSANRFPNMRALVPKVRTPQAP